MQLTDVVNSVRRSSKRLGWRAAAAAGVATCFLASAAAPAGATRLELTRPAAPPTRQAGDSVTTRWLHVVDHRRWTISHGHVLARSRTLPVLVLRPTAPGSHPLVVFCHGYDITPIPYLHMLRHWAAAGFVVAAPYFPLTRPGAGRWLDESDVSKQPGDVSVVITSVVRTLQGVVDTDHIVVAGHSDGGSTAFATGFEKHDADPRITAIMAFSADRWGPASAFAAPRWTLPLLLIQSDRDELNPPSSAGVLWQIAHHPKAYLHLHGARHLPPFARASAWRPVVEAVTTDFLRAWTTSDAAVRDRDLRALDADGARAGLSRVTRD